MGTTLGILAPYLPYGIEVEDKEGLRHELIGLNNANTKGERMPLAEIWPKEKSSWTVRPVDGLTPILRSFDQLCTPLEDGTVPAVEVAKLLANDWAGDYHYDILPSARAVAGLSGVVIRMYEPAGHMDDSDSEMGSVSIYSDWTFAIGQSDGRMVVPSNLVLAFRYLYASLFAVGLTAEQFIRKQS